MSDSVLITGGCGFIGSHLVALLHERGYELHVLDNLHRGEEENLGKFRTADDVTIYRGDVRDREVVADAMDGVEYVVHLAATCLNRSIEYPAESLDVNLIGSNVVFQEAARQDVEKVLFASSASVYGDQPIPMAEDDKVAPQTPYGVAKYASEEFLEFYAEQGDLDYVSYRFFNVYGAGQDTDAYYTSVINVFVQRIVNGDAPVIHGSGDQTMDFIHVQDIARALAAGIESDVRNDLFNVGSGEMTSIAELAELLIDIVDVDVEAQYEDRDVIVSHRKADTSHARDVLGFEAEVPLRRGLEEVVDRVISDMESGRTD